MLKLIQKSCLLNWVLCEWACDKDNVYVTILMFKLLFVGQIIVEVAQQNFTSS